MAETSFTIRSPTGRAWLAFVVGFVLAGEVVWEARKETTATFFNIPFTDGELWAWAAGFGFVALIGLVWLLSLYLAPGRLVLETGGGNIRRELRPVLRRRVIAAPSREWHARLVFFSAAHRQRGIFKRIELSAPGFVEVLLFTDLRRGEELVRALDTIEGELGTFAVHVEQPHAVPDEPPAE
jgi:hypothetical protein